MRPRRGNALRTKCGTCSEDVAYPLKPPLFSNNKVTSRKSKKLWTKGPEWNNAAYVYYNMWSYYLTLFTLLLLFNFFIKFKKKCQDIMQDLRVLLLSTFFLNQEIIKLFFIPLDNFLRTLIMKVLKLLENAYLTNYKNL